MSRSILIQQIESMPDSFERDMLNKLNKEYKPGEGWNVYFEIVDTGENSTDFNVRIIVEKEQITPSYACDFESVPIIKKYLQDTGCMQSAFDRYCKEVDEQKERVRKELLG